MKILFIRHAEPAYAHDSLTPKGRVDHEFGEEKGSVLHAAAYGADDLAGFFVADLQNGARLEFLLNLFQRFGQRLDRPVLQNLGFRLERTALEGEDLRKVGKGSGGNDHGLELLAENLLR